ncbi:uncharacterized protein CLIB1444_01S07294 [[Candida] jaroonii]|uniref:Uncharacterized protein n=1 Tax=[Candida] jaroonii TaxID=467808 RepID=A0ACA9Y0L8_9ASCO|nr:uncharacterized protein CLIB1444_01S07294 [[Candida] jaroonii]
MAAGYTILGKQIPSHVLSILTLGSVATIAAWPRAKAEPAPTAVVPAAKEDDFDLEKFFNDLTKEESK